MAETSWNAKSKRAPMKSVTEDPSQLQFTPQRSKFGATQAGQTRLPAGAISEEDTPSPLEIGEIRSRAAQLKERIWRLRLPSRHSTGQETAQWEEQKDLIVHKQELDEKRLLLISEQKNKIDGTVLDVKMRALWSENRLVALKRELLREENLLSISEEKGPISPKDRSKSDDIRSEIANALTNLIKIQDDLLYYQPVFWKYRFQHHSQSYLFHEVLVYAESILFILESQVGLQKGKEANKSTDEQSRINSLRRVADAQQELLNMQKMTYQEMIGTTQEKETHSQGESEEEKTELLQGMSVIRQEKGTPGQAESVKEIKQTEDASKQLELILEQTQVAAEIKREDHHVTVEEIHSHFSAMFETTLDALLLLTSSSTLTLEHLMEGFSDFFWVIGCIDGISDNSHGGWHVTQLGRALSHTNQRIVREIKKTAVAGELSPIFDVKELRFPEQKIKGSTVGNRQAYKQSDFRTSQKKPKGQLKTSVNSGPVSTQDQCQLNASVNSGPVSTQDQCQFKTQCQLRPVSPQGQCQLRTSVRSRPVSNQNHCQLRTNVKSRPVSTQDHCQLKASVNSRPLYRRVRQLLSRI
ncbi:uncharacterized protein LOC110983518 isoform X4 [Acanthaster planci]|uniref:Uncharacterized protein LOC110983518 isoform X4 n=1 Tax=Acanthaster planci TaxID=133434 RepID=A0A8B7YYU5_ACAPL|nr:uncharacterized protein LOC110983518 isoform X4 [Acanthaster planci]